MGRGEIEALEAGVFAQLRENVKAWGRAFGSPGGFSLLPFSLPPSGILFLDKKNNLINPPAEDAISLASILAHSPIALSRAFFGPEPSLSDV